MVGNKYTLGKSVLPEYRVGVGYLIQLKVSLLLEFRPTCLLIKKAGTFNPQVSNTLG